MKKSIEIYDTTLRDGAQQPGICFSAHDKLRIVEQLDSFGVDFIELGWPGSNDTDTQVFKAVKNIRLKTAKIVAFGMTCQKELKPENDRQLAALLDAGTEFITIVGKTSSWHVEKTLGITLKENLRLIRESCRFLERSGRKVFFDAEHFFDGYKTDREYATECIYAAFSAGASRIILCDTKGGSLPQEIGSIVASVKEECPSARLGIHAHNDGELAVANSLAAVSAGADQVQVTINGYGERCGNANLCSVVPGLRIKMGLPCVLDKSMPQLSSLAHFVAEVANLSFEPRQPYVGGRAFHHKAGLHASAISKQPESYNHINPELVGNTSSVVVSELSGRSNILSKAKDFGIHLSPDQAVNVLAQVKILENQGFQLDGADGFLKLLMKRQADGYRKPFQILDRDVRSKRSGETSVESAIVKVKINNSLRALAHEVAEGDGPVNALDNALRKALEPHFPCLRKIKLSDYKVRVLPGKQGTAKAVRVLIDFSDGNKEWTMVGCSTDLIEASLQALVCGFEFAILANF